MSQRPPQFPGLLLAGGLSRRMGGGQKCLLELGGQTLISRIFVRFSSQVVRIAISANGDSRPFQEFGVPVLPDPVSGFLGPLAGILAGLRWTSNEVPGATHMVSVSSDVPFLPENLVDRLSSVDRSPAKIILTRSLGTLHPVIGLWPVMLADELERDLQRGTRSVRNWVEEHSVETVDFPVLRVGASEIDPFFNINTPADLDEARRVLADSGA